MLKFQNKDILSTQKLFENDFFETKYFVSFM